MITILSIVFGFYVLAEVLKSSSAKKARQREAERQARINAEIQREREERIRIVEEQRRIATEQREHAKALVELAREQRRQEAEQARQAKLVEQHDKEILKLNKRISALETAIGVADYDIQIEQDNITQYSDKLRRLDEELSHANWEIESWKGQRHLANVAKAEAKRDKIQDSINAWEEKVHKAEKRLYKAERAKSIAQKELDMLKEGEAA